MERILLHTCCAPCTITPLRRLRLGGWSVHGFFFNPNIHPFQEYEKRLEGLLHFSKTSGLEVIVRDEYRLEEFLRQVAFREQNRCIVCYSTRIDATARIAKKSGFRAFTTTLLYSRQQKHELVLSLCEEASNRHGIEFHYEDFRREWREGQEEAKRLGLYRQQYCGCIYSERDRFMKRSSGKGSAVDQEA